MQNKEVLDTPEVVGKPSVYIKTFGCQMNEHDSQKLYRILESQYQLSTEMHTADLVLVNTCSVRELPEHKLYSLLGQLRDLKQEKPSLIIGVGGCVAQQEGERILKRNKAVDFVFGTHNLSLVPSLIALRKSGYPPQVAVNYRDEWESLPLGLVGGSPISCFVSISRGCNKNCSYCIVPVTRGKEVSRAFSEIEKEVRIAVHNGAKEVVLLGQTVNSYGRDLDPRISFVELVERVSAIDGVQRIRFTSPHPQEIRDDFIECVASNSKLCHHIHMPLQSGSNVILKAMRRNYRRERYLEIIQALKDRVPDMAITTDIIVGFPGEGEKEFKETMEVMDIVEFDNSYSFIFSPRPGTDAAAISDSESHEDKLERLYILQARQLEISAKRLNYWVGKKVELLMEGQSTASPERMQGRTSQNLVVNVAAHPSLKTGELVEVEIVRASRFTLQAKVVV